MQQRHLALAGCGTSAYADAPAAVGVPLHVRDAQVGSPATMVGGDDPCADEAPNGPHRQAEAVGRLLSRATVLFVHAIRIGARRKYLHLCVGGQTGWWPNCRESSLVTDTS